MAPEFTDLPNRLVPYIVMRTLNEPVAVAQGPFRLVGGPKAVTIDGDLAFRWLPSTAVAFGGSCSVPYLGVHADDLTLESDRPFAFSAPVSVTGATIGSHSSEVHGVLKRELVVGEGKFERLRFCLVNFPEYIGALVRFERNGEFGLATVRLEAKAAPGTCRVDAIADVQELRQRLKRDAGFVISHVGEWVPESGSMTTSDARDLFYRLNVFPVHLTRVATEQRGR
jgi:hypothetical protein